MQDLKERFIQLALDSQALKFGTFTLKSGRESPYFFNAGMFYQGSVLREIGDCYARTLADNHINVDNLFGPAYKGLPLATAAAIALADRNIDVTVTFNRKEIKHHGEGGQLIGAPLQGNTVMIDDVITAGTAFREAKALITQYGGHLKAVVVCLDRSEYGLNPNQSTLEDIVSSGIPVFSIITAYDLVDYLRKNKMRHEAKAMEVHLSHYGLPRTL